MKTIRFLRDYEVQAEGGPKYEAGQKVSLSVASAQHFLTRRVAVESPPEPRAKAEPKPAARKPTAAQAAAKDALEADG